MMPFPGESASYGVVADYIISILEGRYFVVTRIETYCRYTLAFPSYNAPAQITLCELTECFIHHHDIPHSITSDQGNHSTAKKGQRWVRAQEFTCIIIFTTTLKQLTW